MKNFWIFWVFWILAFFIIDLSLVVRVSAQDKQRVFEGVDKCKICHKNPQQGEQYRIWSESLHAKAYETLAGDKAKQYGEKRGIENPQTAPQCLKCHVTAYGVDAQFLGPKYKITDGVGCESCHGAGEEYSKLKTMKAVTAGTMDPASVGLVIPDEKVCIGCHNEESPAFKGFDFEEFSKKIAHPIPDSTKQKYRK